MLYSTLKDGTLLPPLCLAFLLHLFIFFGRAKIKYTLEKSKNIEVYEEKVNTLHNTLHSFLPQLGMYLSTDFNPHTIQIYVHTVCVHMYVCEKERQRQRD